MWFYVNDIIPMFLMLNHVNISIKHFQQDTLNIVRNGSLFEINKSLQFLNHESYVWEDDLLFYVLFNSISVIQGRCLDDNERLCAVELCLLLRRFPLK